MNNSAFRYALNTSLRGLVSLHYGMPSLADDDFMIVPSDGLYYGFVYSGGPIIKLKSISYMGASMLNLMQYWQFRSHSSLWEEIAQYEDIMGI